MSILIKGMEMPKDCPMCPLSHWNASGNFTGCDVVGGKRYAMADPKYANSNVRPDWCPLVPIPPHGRLIDADAIHLPQGFFERVQDVPAFFGWLKTMPTVIEGEEEK